MDPEACIARCERHLETRDLTSALEALVDYWDWRESGGYEPEHGDDRANDCVLGLMAELTRRATWQTNVRARQRRSSAPEADAPAR